MKYAQSEPLRKKMYLASMARGTAGLRDNTPLMTQILQLRQEWRVFWATKIMLSIQAGHQDGQNPN